MVNRSAALGSFSAVAHRRRGDDLTAVWEKKQACSVQSLLPSSLATHTCPPSLQPTGAGSPPEAVVEMERLPSQTEWSV